MMEVNQACEAFRKLLEEQLARIEGMKAGKLTVTADNGATFTVNCDLTERQQAILLAGGLLNYTKEGGQ